MSIKLQSQVWEECTDVSGTKLLLLLALADFADDQCQCFPKIKTLAKRIRTDERVTRKHMKDLRELGYIEVLDNSNGRRSNIYKVHVNPVKIDRSKKTGQKRQVTSDRSNPVKFDTPSNLYNEPSVEPPEKKGTNVPKENAAPSSLSEGDFPDFWLPCLKKVARPAALQAWKRMRKEKRTDLTALELVERYNKAVEVSAAEKNGSKKFAPHPSTWLNQDRWNDEIEEPPKKFPFTLPQNEYGYNGGIYPELHGQRFYVENWDEGRVFDEQGNELVKIWCIGDMEYGPRL